MFLGALTKPSQPSGETTHAENLRTLQVGLSFTPPNPSSQSSGLPSAYLRYVLYNETGTKALRSGRVFVTTAVKTHWERLHFDYEVPANGVLQIYIANETENEPVYFDDMVVEHTPQLIVQENHYYPFGMNLRGIEKVGKPEHKYLYNAGTELEKSFDLNFYETEFRRYDAQLGRFHGIDELAPLMSGITPYQYAFNNPILFNDPTGLAPEGSDAIEDRRLDDWTQENEEYGRHQNTLLDAQHGRGNSSGGVGNNKLDHGHSCPTHGAGCSGYHPKKSSRLKAAAVMTLASPAGKALFEGLKAPHPIVKAAAVLGTAAVLTYYYYSDRSRSKPKPGVIADPITEELLKPTA
ncbi:cell well associated RhsD protein [Microscilla marina ATCC 23134]|uniref:Cell well associated RhsD protein n=1 Tax=Microscilla marina ATCC 23134 TaxID=313606 RepID=A2A0G8_MICM2|nr:cell well associated RhsD protein [Microscilla marina ATCC 23134]